MRTDLLKNKLFALAFVLIGLISIWACDWDASACVFCFPLAIYLFVARKDVFDESQYLQEVELLEDEFDE